jgi:hypothetical protein
VFANTPGLSRQIKESAARGRGASSDPYLFALSEVWGAQRSKSGGGLRPEGSMVKMVKVILCHACAGTGVNLKKSQRMTCEICGGSGLTKAAGTANVADSPKHWQNRAEVARSLAEDLRDEGAKSMMLRNAKDYDTIVARVEKRINQAKRWRRG